MLEFSIKQSQPLKMFRKCHPKAYCSGILIWKTEKCEVFKFPSIYSEPPKELNCYQLGKINSYQEVGKDTFTTSRETVLQLIFCFLKVHASSPKTIYWREFFSPHDHFSQLSKRVDQRIVVLSLMDLITVLEKLFARLLIMSKFVA